MINKIVSLCDLLNIEVDKIKGKTVEEIKRKLSIDSNAKNVNRMIFDSVINNSDNKEKIISLFKELNCVIKTINLEWNDNLKESISLNVFKYVEIVKETWESSSLRNYFKNNIFVFVVFKKDYKDSKFIDIKVWKMPNTILESEVKSIWNYTRNLVLEGKIVNYIDDRNRYITFFPSKSETKYVHVRPHAQNAEDTLLLPVKDKLTKKEKFVKHSFWLNNTFIKKIVVEGKYYE